MVWLQGWEEITLGEPTPAGTDGRSHAIDFLPRITAGPDPHILKRGILTIAYTVSLPNCNGLEIYKLLGLLAA